MTDQNASIYPHRICYVEDSPVVSGPIKFGMEKLLGAHVDLFSTTNKALRQFQTDGFNKWGVYVLDNRTGHGNMSGLDLAKTIRQEVPRSIVVSLNSSDMGEITNFGLDKLAQLGIEFWYKMTESFLMIAWLADCAKEGVMIPRNEWMTRMGEPTRYFDPTFDDPRPSEKAIRMMIMRAENSNNYPDEQTGVLMKENTRSFIQNLIEPSSGTEKRK